MKSFIALWVNDADPPNILGVFENKDEAIEALIDDAWPYVGDTYPLDDQTKQRLKAEYLRDDQLSFQEVYYYIFPISIPEPITLLSTINELCAENEILKDVNKAYETAIAASPGGELALKAAQEFAALKAQ